MGVTLEGIMTDQRRSNLPGYITTKPAVLIRLRRVEGQIRGLQRMVDEDTDCIDILTQVSAAKRALETVALELLREHLRHCLVHAPGAVGAPAEVDGAFEAITRLVRS